MALTPQSSQHHPGVWAACSKCRSSGPFLDNFDCPGWVQGPCGLRRPQGQNKHFRALRAGTGHRDTYSHHALTQWLPATCGFLLQNLRLSSEVMLVTLEVPWLPIWTRSSWRKRAALQARLTTILKVQRDQWYSPVLQQIIGTCEAQGSICGTKNKNKRLKNTNGG